jgi:beta-glucanase (GH16 family)
MSTGCVSSLLPIAGPGYYEARIKASPSSLGSAFFLQIRSGQEIDISENYGRSSTTPALGLQARSHTHWFPQGYKRENDTDSAIPLSVPNTEWHVYGVWIQSPTRAVFYVDGKRVTTHHMKGRFTQPMYMFFAQEPSTYQGIPTSADLTDKARFTMQVDWVRTYTRK